MKKQRTTEWLEGVKNPSCMQYHEKQFANPYRSTVAFCDFLEENDLIKPHTNIIDMCAGQGANSYYMAKRYPHCHFDGIDINPMLVETGNEALAKLSQHNCALYQGDLYNLDTKYIGKYDGLVCYQTLSWLPEYKTPLEKMVELNTSWIAMTSLFFDGNLNCTIQVQDYNEPVAGKPYAEYYYNTYSLRLIEQFFNEHGYKKVIYQPFEIDIDLPNAMPTGKGTYTEKLVDGRRLQFSGPLLMNWYFVVAIK